MSGNQYPYVPQKSQLITTNAFIPQTNPQSAPILTTQSVHQFTAAAQNQLAAQQVQQQPQYQPYVPPQYPPQVSYSYTPIQPTFTSFPPVPDSAQNSANALWIGDVESWMDENFIYSLFVHTRELVNVKIIRDKYSGQSSGYGFIYFTNPQAAQYVMENFNGQLIPGTKKVFRLNYAAHGVNLKRNEAHALFIGDLSPDVNEYYLLTTFQYYYPSVYSARIVLDPTTGASKGYGFVYFNDDKEKARALNEMQGFYLSYRPIKVNLASKKSNASLPGTVSFPQPPPKPAPLVQPQVTLPTLSPSDPHNTTVFVGGIDSSITHEILRGAFCQFGDIVGIKIPFGKGCGFVEFATHQQAAHVLSELNGAAIIGNCQVRLSWGRPTLKIPSSPPNLGVIAAAQRNMTQINAQPQLSEDFSQTVSNGEGEQISSISEVSSYTLQQDSSHIEQPPQEQSQKIEDNDHSTLEPKDNIPPEQEKKKTNLEETQINEESETQESTRNPKEKESIESTESKESKVNTVNQEENVEEDLSQPSKRRKTETIEEKN